MTFYLLSTSLLHCNQTSAKKAGHWTMHFLFKSHYVILTLFSRSHAILCLYQRAFCRLLLSGRKNFLLICTAGYCTIRAHHTFYKINQVQEDFLRFLAYKECDNSAEVWIMKCSFNNCLRFLIVLLVAYFFQRLNFWDIKCDRSSKSIKLVQKSVTPYQTSCILLEDMPSSCSFAYLST